MFSIGCCCGAGGAIELPPPRLLRKPVFSPNDRCVAGPASIDMGGCSLWVVRGSVHLTRLVRGLSSSARRISSTLLLQTPANSWGSPCFFRKRQALRRSLVLHIV